MKTDIMEIKEGDVVMVQYNVGCLTVEEIDNRCKTLSDELKATFGCNVTLFPQRGGIDGTWDFTIIRNPVRKYPFHPNKKKVKKVVNEQ